MRREHRLPRRRCGAAPWLLLPLIAACGSSSEAHSGGALRFTAIPDQNKTELEQKYRVVADTLSEALGVPVEYVPTTSYDASVEAFKNGDVHLAWFGGVSGVQARDAVPGARAIAQGKVDPEFVSYFVAHADAGIQPGSSFPSAMEGKRFTFGDRGSTSGRLMPEHFIRVNTGKAPDEFFSQVGFQPGHDQTALQVQAGSFDCGALNYKVYDRMVDEGTIDPTVCVKVWTTPPYADYNWTIHPVVEEHFGAGFSDRVQAALVGISDPAVLKALGREEGLIAAENSDFESIAATMEQVGMRR